MDSTGSVIGAFSTAPIQVWDGFEAHTVLLRDVLTPAEILQIAKKAGV